MKLLVTGGAGFIGSHFIRYWLKHRPDGHIINIDLLTYAGAESRLADLKQAARYRFVQGNICDPPAVAGVIGGCDAVVHFAAETHVDRSITDAAPFLRTNVEGVYSLLQASLAAKVKRFLHISTDEVYGPVLKGAVDEQAPLAPRSPYAASKAAGDLLAQAFRDTYALPVIVARPTNVYGPGQFPEKFIPLCISSAIGGRPVPIYGDGLQRRAWLHVEDCCAALALLLEGGACGEVYNIGSGSEQVNRDVAKRVLAELGRPEALLKVVEDRPGHDRRYALNDEKLRRLGWKAAIDFKSGLTQTIRWYKDNESWWLPLTEKLREDSYHWLNRPAGASAQPEARKRS